MLGTRWREVNAMPGRYYGDGKSATRYHLVTVVGSECARGTGGRAGARGAGARAKRGVGAWRNVLRITCIASETLQFTDAACAFSFSSCSFRSSRQRLYWSALPGSGSSSFCNQKRNQSTLPS